MCYWDGLQIFNNWSPYLVNEPGKVWIGLEYFCYDTDDLWKMEDECAASALPSTRWRRSASWMRMRSATGTSCACPRPTPLTSEPMTASKSSAPGRTAFENLFLVGRNGMHKYNNQDHSMLTAMTVVDGLVAGNVDKAALWEINTEQEYHETKDKNADRKTS